MAAVCFAFSCSERERAEVVFWQFQPHDLMQAIVADFERENPSAKVRVETLTWQSGYEKILMAFSSGKVPDLLEVGSTWLPRFWSEDAIEDLSEATRGLEDRLMMWDLCTFEGRRFGVPWLIGSRVLFYNKRLFEAAGLSPEAPPETWGELLGAARAIHKPDEGVYGFGMNAGERYVLFKKFMPFGWGNHGGILSDDLKTCILNSPENLEALRFYLSLKPYSVLERQDMIDEMFKRGAIGLMISGGWNLARIPEDAPDLEYGVAFIPRPDEDGLHASFAGAEILVVPKGARREAAIRLAEFLASPRQALRVAGQVKGVQPASIEALSDPYYDEHPMERLLLEQCKTSFSPPPSPSWTEIEDVMNERLEACLYGKLSPEEALLLMQDDINAILERAAGTTE